MTSAAIGLTGTPRRNAIDVILVRFGVGLSAGVLIFSLSTILIEWIVGIAMLVGVHFSDITNDHDPNCYPDPDLEEFVIRMATPQSVLPPLCGDAVTVEERQIGVIEKRPGGEVSVELMPAPAF